jgi:hypothetical protein
MSERKILLGSLFATAGIGATTAFASRADAATSNPDGSARRAGRS